MPTPPRTTPSAASADLQLSDEVRWYLDSREIPPPTCPPKIKTPEPGRVAGARFDPERVDRVLRVFSLLRHTQGEWAGKPLVPDPWEVAYILAPIYGWVRRRRNSQTWVRIIRSAYIEMPRKNGKTTLAGGQAMYLTAADGEAGAQVYAVAAAKDQARYCYEPVRLIAANSPALKPYVTPLRDRIVHKPSGSFFAVASSVADLLHGANIHGAIIDELHIYKNPQLVEAIETGTGARAQPLVVVITTADEGQVATVYAERRSYVEKVATGTIRDDSLYGVVWSADEDDDPFAEDTWRKANPGYGISPSVEYLEAAAHKAKGSPASLASFKRLHLGIRTGQDSRYFTLGVWDANAGIIDPLSLAGAEAYGGLDLASTSDLTAFAIVVPDHGGGHDVLWRHWLPEDALANFNLRTAGQADVWVREGWLTLTPGNVCDYDYVQAQIARDMATYAIGEIAYDPWNASQLVNDLTAEGVPMVPVRQGFASLSPPTKELLRLLLDGSAGKPRFRHGANPLVRWQASHMAVETDPAGNVKPSKRRAADKIDGFVAAIMALDRATRHQPAVPSAYEDRGVTIL